jgi:hypothetical protein
MESCEPFVPQLSSGTFTAKKYKICVLELFFQVCSREMLAEDY